MAGRARAVRRAAACARVPPPPYVRNFTASGRLPVAFETARETTVRLSIRNTGTAPGIPRAFICPITGCGSCRASSRTARERCRTTTASAPSSATPWPPGAAIALEGRMLAPTWPGRLLAAVGHGGGGRHLVRAGRAAPAAHARRRAAADAPGSWRRCRLPSPSPGSLPRRVAARRRCRARWLCADTADVSWCVATLATKPLILVARGAARADRRRLLADAGRRDCRCRWCCWSLAAAARRVRGCCWRSASSARC